MLLVSYPRQVILITSRYNEKDNIMTASWHTPVSFDPELYAVVIGKSRFSLELIERSNVFAVNFIPRELETQAVMVGRTSGRHKDKFKESKLEKQEASTIDCPVLAEAVAHLECEVQDKIDAGDHVIIIGKVMQRNINKSSKRLFQLITGNKFTTTLE